MRFACFIDSTQQRAIELEGSVGSRRLTRKQLQNTPVVEQISCVELEP